VVGEQQAAPARRQATDKQVVLHRNRDAIQWAKPRALRLAGIGRRGGCAGAGLVDQGEGIQLRFQRRLARQALLQQRGRRHLAGVQPRRQRGGIQLPERAHAACTWVRMNWLRRWSPLVVGG
jgi:hypothetical protein